MDNFFELPVVYNGEAYLFNAELVAYAYSYTIEVNVFGQLVAFEPDEERHFRALIKADDLLNHALIARSLLEAIASALVLLFKDES